MANVIGQYLAYVGYLTESRTEIQFLLERDKFTRFRVHQIIKHQIITDTIGGILHITVYSNFGIAILHKLTLRLNLNGFSVDKRRTLEIYIAWVKLL